VDSPVLEVRFMSDMNLTDFVPVSDGCPLAIGGRSGESVDFVPVGTRSAEDGALGGGTESVVDFGSVIGGG
jgi:hypothetical protein